MDVNGSVYFLENAKKENNYDIDLDLKFANFDIKHFSNIYKSYLNWEGANSTTVSIMDYDLSNDYAYHKYKSDNLSIFNDYVSQFDSIQNQFLNFDGKMNGQILVNNRFPLKNFIDIELDSFRLSNVFSVKV